MLELVALGKKSLHIFLSPGMTVASTMPSWLPPTVRPTWIWWNTTETYPLKKIYGRTLVRDTEVVECTLL
jgi:hypothetical protein